MSIILNKINYSAFKFNHETAGAVQEICDPLFKYSGIGHFEYVKIHSNGKMLRLSTGVEWTNNYFQNQYYNDAEFYYFDDIPENGSCNKIFTHNPVGKVLTELYQHNIWNIFAIYVKNNEFAEVYFFATSKENKNIINFYLNEHGLLASFIDFFKRHAHSILSTLNPNHLIETTLQFSNSTIHRSNFFKIQFLLDISDYSKQKNNTLTPREMECAKELMKGNSAKQIARVMSISPRTIEHHIGKLKEKLGCKKTSQLISLLVTL